MKIRLWHIGSVIIISTTLLAIQEMPASAFLLNNLEAKISSIIQPNGASTATIPGQLVKPSFNVLRGIFLVLLTSAAIYKLQPKHQQRNQESEALKVGSRK